MKHLLCVALLVSTVPVFADCKSALPLEGTVSINTCDPAKNTCIPGAKAVHDYMDKVPDDPAVLTIGIQSSPWRFYDEQMRIISIEDMAGRVRSILANHKEVTRIELLASWTGVAPEPGGKSLAQRLSAALGGFPVSGKDGFLWLARDGSMRTTHQAFSMMLGGRYSVAEGEEVMVALTTAWPAEVEGQLLEKREAEGVMLAGAGWDIFFLCPDHALQSFEAAAKLSNPIAAYNAALMRLERRGKGDVEAATALLAQAAAAGDRKAQARLEKLRRDGR